MPCLHGEDAAKARLELGAPASPARQACGTTWRMTGPRRTILDRRRRPLIDPETVALFRELEAVPMRQRESREFWERAYGLHKRLGLNGEFFLLRSVRSRSQLASAVAASLLSSKLVSGAGGAPAIARSERAPALGLKAKSVPSCGNKAQGGPGALL